MEQHDAKTTDGQNLAKRRAMYLIGTLLSFSAGAVNGAATVALVFERTMHMSGRGNDLLRDLIFDLPEGLLVACLIGSFVLGAFLAGLLVPRRGVNFALLGCAGLLAVAAIAASAGETYDLNRYVVASLLAMAGGAQNSATSQSKVGRTTHITGDLTDMAIAFSTGNRGCSIFLMSKLTAFSAGGLAGFMGVQYGNLSFVLMVCSVMIIVATLFRPEAGGRFAVNRQLTKTGDVDPLICDRLKMGTNG